MWVQVGGGFGGDGRKISKTIGFMNKNVALVEPIAYSEVADSLAMIGEGEAGKLLHELQEQAESIKNPTRWLIAACNRRM